MEKLEVKYLRLSFCDVQNMKFPRVVKSRWRWSDEVFGKRRWKDSGALRVSGFCFFSFSLQEPAGVIRAPPRSSGPIKHRQNDCVKWCMNVGASGEFDQPSRSLIGNQNQSAAILECKWCLWTGTRDSDSSVYALLLRVTPQNYKGWRDKGGRLWHQEVQKILCRLLGQKVSVQLRCK